MRLSLLDRAFYLLDGARSPQDFTVIFDLRHVPDVERLVAGARSAMNRFPTSACTVEGRAWVWRENKFNLETSSAIEDFIDKRFDLRREQPIKQLLVLNGSSARLATRFHHAAADGFSAALWLGHQLNVAYELEPAQLTRSQFNGPTLRRSANSVRCSQFAFDGPSDALRTSHSKRSGLRRWSTISFPSNELQKACRHAGGFTYHDLLATCTLEMLRDWNNKRCKIGLWVPMNVRRQVSEGFGNGTSRIRVYASYDHETSLVEKCHAVRRQVAWSTKHGEWVVPENPWLERLPDSIASLLLRRYLQLPKVDMATAVFTHAGSLLANGGEAFKHVERIECVGLLHPRQNLAINAATHSGHTWLTFTYDPALLTTDDVKQLTQLYLEQNRSLKHRERLPALHHRVDHQALRPNLQRLATLPNNHVSLKSKPIEAKVRHSCRHTSEIVWS